MQKLGLKAVQTPIIDSEQFRDNQLLYQISNYLDSRDLLKIFHLKVQEEQKQEVLDKERLEAALINPLLAEAKRGYQETIINKKYQYEYDQGKLQYANFLERNHHRGLINSNNSQRRVESANAIAYGIEKKYSQEKKKKNLKDICKSH